jgi:hypothetical protein
MVDHQVVRYGGPETLREARPSIIDRVRLRSFSGLYTEAIALAGLTQVFKSMSGMMDDFLLPAADINSPVLTGVTCFHPVSYPGPATTAPEFGLRPYRILLIPPSSTAYFVWRCVYRSAFPLLYLLRSISGGRR